MNKNRYFVRLDASRRPVSGSNVARKKKPVTGNWLEITGWDCCAPFTIVSSTPADVSLASITFTLSCGAAVVAVHDIPTATTTLTGIVDALNSSLSIYGVFTENGTAIDLKINQDIKDSLCPADDLTFVITETAP